MNESSAVLALLAAAEPDGPQEHEVCSVVFLAVAVRSFRTHLTDREALNLVFRALCGLDEWAQLPPSRMTVYQRGHLDRLTPLCRTPVDPHDGGQLLPSAFACQFRQSSDMEGYFVVWEQAREVFGLRAPAPVQTPPTPALDAVQSEPPPEIEMKPTKRPGDDWTPADYAELLRQYESLTSGQDVMKGEAAREALGKAWSYAPNSIKSFLTTARRQRGATT